MTDSMVVQLTCDGVPADRLRNRPGKQHAQVVAATFVRDGEWPDGRPFWDSLDPTVLLDVVESGSRLESSREIRGGGPDAYTDVTIPCPHPDCSRRPQFQRRKLDAVLTAIADVLPADAAGVRSLPLREVEKRI